MNKLDKALGGFDVVDMVNDLLSETAEQTKLRRELQALRRENNSKVKSAIERLSPIIKLLDDKEYSVLSKELKEVMQLLLESEL